MAENIENNGCCKEIMRNMKGMVKSVRSFNWIWKERDSAQPRLLEMILYKDNFKYSVRELRQERERRKFDGMTIEEALPYLRNINKNN